MVGWFVCIIIYVFVGVDVEYLGVFIDIVDWIFLYIGFVYYIYVFIIDYIGYKW